MKLLIVFTCALLAAGVARAQPYSIIKRQAIQANNPPPAKPSPAPLQVPAPIDPVLQATLRNIGNLQGDFGTLAGLTNSAAIAAEKPALTNDLNTAAQGTKPAAESISKLADDLAAAIAGNDKLRPQHRVLAQFVHASFNGAQLVPAQQQMICGGAQKILDGSGAPPDAVTNVVNDLKTIADQTK